MAAVRHYKKSQLSTFGMVRSGVVQCASPCKISSLYLKRCWDITISNLFSKWQPSVILDIIKFIWYFFWEQTSALRHSAKFHCVILTAAEIERFKFLSFWHQNAYSGPFCVFGDVTPWIGSDINETPKGTFLAEKNVI